jgi:hypothetical protein
MKIPQEILIARNKNNLCFNSKDRDTLESFEELLKLNNIEYENIGKAPKAKYCSLYMPSNSFKQMFEIFEFPEGFFSSCFQLGVIISKDEIEMFEKWLEICYNSMSTEELYNEFKKNKYYDGCQWKRCEKALLDFRRGRAVDIDIIFKHDLKHGARLINKSLAILSNKLILKYFYRQRHMIQVAAKKHLKKTNKLRKQDNR